MAVQNLKNSTLTKADLVDRVYEQVGLSKKEAADLVEMVFDKLKEVLIEGEKVKISGFGNFFIQAKHERVGRNPQTGDQMKITKRRVLKFRPSQVLRGILNGKHPGAHASDDDDGDDEFDHDED